MAALGEKGWLPAEKRGRASAAPLPRGTGSRRYQGGWRRVEEEMPGRRRWGALTPAGLRARPPESAGYPGLLVRAARDGGRPRSGAEVLTAPRAAGLSGAAQAAGRAGSCGSPGGGRGPRAAGRGRGALTMACPMGRCPGGQAPRPAPRPPPHPVPWRLAGVVNAPAMQSLALLYRRVQKGRSPGGGRPPPSLTHPSAGRSGGAAKGDGCRRQLRSESAEALRPRSRPRGAAWRRLGRAEGPKTLPRVTSDLSPAQCARPGHRHSARPEGDRGPRYPGPRPARPLSRAIPQPWGAQPAEETVVLAGLGACSTGAEKLYFSTETFPARVPSALRGRGMSVCRRGTYHSCYLSPAHASRDNAAPPVRGRRGPVEAAAASASIRRRRCGWM